MHAAASVIDGPTDVCTQQPVPLRTSGVWRYGSGEGAVPLTRPRSSGCLPGAAGPAARVESAQDWLDLLVGFEPPERSVRALELLPATA